MAPAPHHLSWRHISPRLAGHSLPPLQRQHDMGCHFKGGNRHVLLQRSADNSQELQNDLRLVYYHGDDDDRAGWSWAGRWVCAVRLADHESDDDLAIGEHCDLSFSTAACVESRVDAVHFLRLSWVREESIEVAYQHLAAVTTEWRRYLDN